MIETLSLDQLQSAKYFNSALALKVPDSISKLVRRFREEISRYTTVSPQHLPHVTLLYLGRLRGDILMRFAELQGLTTPEPIQTNIKCLSTFPEEGRVGVIHLTVDLTPKLLNLHLSVLECFEQLGQSSPTPFVRHHYIPHVSIADGLDLSRNEASHWIKHPITLCKMTLTEYLYLTVKSETAP